MKSGHVYIMANRRRGKTYLGISSKLPLRVYQHKNGHFDGYNKDKGCYLLVWYEFHEDLQNAWQREAQMKKWKRDWKLKLIDAFNPDWVDLYHVLPSKAVMFLRKQECLKSGAMRTKQRSCLRRSTARFLFNATVRQQKQEGRKAHAACTNFALALRPHGIENRKLNGNSGCAATLFC